MPTIMQKIRLALRGWSRRRDEAQKEFLARNLERGGHAAAVRAPARPAHSTSTVDIDGLTVAYLDDSGHFAHYLDTETGDILDVAVTQTFAPPRYRRIPQRTPQSESDDRRDFVDGLQPSRGRGELARAIGVPGLPQSAGERPHARARLVQLQERPRHRRDRDVAGRNEKAALTARLGLSSNSVFYGSGNGGT